MKPLTYSRVHETTLNPMATEPSPHLHAPHFQDSNTALMPYLRVVLHGGLFPY